MSIPILICATLSAGAPATDTIASLPVREITVFKDGHAFVLHEGVAPVDESGDVVLDNLPRPVIGTFWPYVAEPGAELAGVVAGTRAVSTETPVQNMAQLMSANRGAAVTLTKSNGETCTGVVKSVVDPAGIVLLDTEAGTRVVAISNVRDLVIHGESATTLEREELRDLLTLDLDWRGAPGTSARVGMAYLEKGFRWIPHYRVSVDGAGTATIRLQATLVNELIDVENVTANLVVGVPSFAFADTLDPIALQETAAQLSPLFVAQQQTAFAFSNAIMTQTPGAHINASGAESGAIGDASRGARNEDHFIFTLSDVTLRKGERMVVPIVEFTLPYRDVFTLDVPMAPPFEVRNQFSVEQKQDLARLLHRPKAKHQVRLENASPYPLTTAPALILRGERLVGQGMMTYTPLGSTVDLELTSAIDIVVDKEDGEFDREPRARTWRGHSYDRVDLSGELRLHNRKDTAVVIEVVRRVLGEVDSVDGGGRAHQVNLYEDDDLLLGTYRSYNGWWYYGSDLWNGVNGVGEIEWRVELEPGASVALGYRWHQFARSR